MSYEGWRRSSHGPAGQSTRESGNVGIGKRTLTMDLPPAPVAPPVQMTRGSGDGRPEQEVPSAPSGGGQPLSPGVRAKMEGSFGADFSAVRVHEGAHASAMGALGYTQGTDIHFAPGQYQPETQSGQELLGHELAHVVQQSQGRVQATTQAKGVDVNDDSSLEREADDLGARAARGEAASAASAAAPINAGATVVQHKVIQRKDVATHYGTFRTTKFEKFGTQGVNCVLTFDPDADKIDAKKIGLSQSVKITYPDGSHTGIDPTKEGRRVESGSGSDYVLDRISTKNNPVYGAGDLGTGEGLDKTAQDNNSSTDPTKVGPAADGGNATYQLGHAYTDAGTETKKEATLYDRPAGGGGNMFETVAMGLDGTDQGKYFGSVKWGYQLKTGDVDIKDIELASMGVPTQSYLAAVELWNHTKTRGTLEVTADPAKAKKITDLSDVDVAKGTKARQLAEVSLAGKPMVKIETLDGTGASTGNQYYVYVVDLKDAQDGGDTANVAVPMVFVNPTVIPLYKDAEMKEKVKDLPVNTRMENTVCTKSGSYGMKIVDGTDLGLTGYVDQTLIQREQ